eukprot:8474959-Heterocapsa_arctica.AAC.1
MAAGTSAQAANPPPLDEDSLDFLQSGVKVLEPRGAGAKKNVQLQARWSDDEPMADEGDNEGEDIDVNSEDL